MLPGLYRISQKEFQLISKLAYDKFGLHLKVGKEGLVAARLGKILRNQGFSSFTEYYQHVINDKSGAALIELIDQLTTNYTSFLRERAHFDLLIQLLTTEFRDCNAVRIWSAACSTGEEPYTIAMCLMDAARNVRCRWQNNIRILATDISTRVLTRAKEGVYDRARLSGAPPHWILEYLLRKEAAQSGTYIVRPEIRRLISFERLNLVEPFSPGLFDVIFCRNVMIYFDRPTQEGIVRRLAGCLESKGYLFIGHSETLSGTEHNLRYVRAAVYQEQGSSSGSRRT